MGSIGRIPMGSGPEFGLAELEKAPKRVFWRCYLMRIPEKEMHS